MEPHHGNGVVEKRKVRARLGGPARHPSELFPESQPDCAGQSHCLYRRWDNGRQSKPVLSVWRLVWQPTEGLGSVWRFWGFRLSLVTGDVPNQGLAEFAVPDELYLVAQHFRHYA